MQADLIHHQSRDNSTEPAHGEVLESSADGLQYTLTLRKGLRFSDASRSMRTMSFHVSCLPNESVHATQRTIDFGGKPITVRKN